MGSKTTEYIKKRGLEWTFDLHVDDYSTYRLWGDKTLYLENVECSGEPKDMAALTL